MNRVGVSQYSDTLPIWTLDHNLVARQCFIHPQCQSHPTLVVSNWRALRRKKLERSAKSVCWIVQLWGTSQKLHRIVVAVCDQSFAVTEIGTYGERFQQTLEV